MSNQREPDPIAAWLRDESRDGAPERLLDATRRQLAATKQRRPWWPTRRFPEMNALTRVAVAGAAVAVVALVGARLLAAQPGPGALATPSPTPSSSLETATPASTTPRQVVVDGSMTAGTYYMQPFGPPNPTMQVVFTVPDGFDYAAGWALIPSDVGAEPPAGIGIGFLQPAGIFRDPCRWDVAGTGAFPQAGDVEVGPTAADLVSALAANGGYESGAPAAVSIGGYSGQRIDLQLPADVDFATCDRPTGSTEGRYVVWGTLHPSGSNLYAQGPGNRWQVNALDVEGGRIAIVVTDFEATSQADRDRVQSIIDSIRIEP